MLFVLALCLALVQDVERYAGVKDLDNPEARESFSEFYSKFESDLEKAYSAVSLKATRTGDGSVVAFEGFGTTDSFVLRGLQGGLDVVLADNAEYQFTLTSEDGSDLSIHSINSHDYRHFDNQLKLGSFFRAPVQHQSLITPYSDLADNKQIRFIDFEENPGAILAFNFDSPFLPGVVVTCRVVFSKATGLVERVSTYGKGGLLGDYEIQYGPDDYPTKIKAIHEFGLSHDFEYYTFDDSISDEDASLSAFGFAEPEFELMPQYAKTWSLANYLTIALIFAGMIAATTFYFKQRK